MKKSTVGQGGKRMSRAEREKQILHIVGSCFGGMTVGTIAKLCGTTNSPHFKGIVYGLFKRGELAGYSDFHWNGRVKYVFYHPNREYLHGQHRMEGF